MHLNVPGTVGPHVLNIFGLATYGMPAEEDADLVVDYANQTLSGVFDYGDATIDPATGEPLFQFFPLTTKIIDDWLEELDAGDLMFAVHTVASGFPTMAIHGLIHAVPEPGAGGLVALGGCGLWIVLRRRRFGTRFIGVGDASHSGLFLQDALWSRCLWRPRRRSHRP